jgi:hypothetical protein
VDALKSRSGFLALFALGLALRVLALPCWGTFDVEIWKAWAAEAATTGLAPLYGPSDAALRAGTPLKPALFEWGTALYQVDYPPGTLLGAWVSGRAYRALSPDMPNRWRFNILVNLPPLLASLGSALVLLGTAPGAEGRVRALAFWLNPALVLAAPALGYQDPIFAFFGLSALLAAEKGRHGAAGALAAASCLVKPQGALLLPVLAVVVLTGAPGRALGRALLGGALAALAILAPWWSSGYLLSALDGCLRPLRQNTLAPLGLNLWWVAGWAVEAARHGVRALAPVLNLDEFRSAAGFDARTASRLILLLLTLLNLRALSIRLPRARGALALAAVFEVHAYACFGTSVHENHTFLAVAIAPLLLGAMEGGAAILASSSAFLLLNLLFTAGLGRRLTPLRAIRDVRASTVPDLSVIVALAYVAFVLWLGARALRAGPGETAGAHESDAPGS